MPVVLFSTDPDFCPSLDEFQRRRAIATHDRRAFSRTTKKIATDVGWAKTRLINRATLPIRDSRTSREIVRDLIDPTADSVATSLLREPMAIVIDS